MDRISMNGKVCLIGAGCGSADLITVRGYQRLMNADVVVYDDLLSEDLIKMLPSKTEIIYVGKRSGKHSATQQAINELLVSLAQQGKNVCRLKGGDPFVFGRGGEEIMALDQHNIPWEVVPGISSCIAIPELAGIPVTHRGIARGFHVITAHTADEGDCLSERIEYLAKLEGTLVFLMGLSRLNYLSESLIAAGKRRATPVAVIGDKTVRGTLENIANKAEAIKAPAVIVVGETAKMNFLNNSKEMKHYE